MTRRTLPALALILAGAVALLSACAPTTTVTAPGGAAARTVSVAATGTAEATPDAARASITVESSDPSSAQVAQAAAAEATTLALDELKAAGVDEKDIATQAINVGPFYDYTSEGGQTLIGYRASQTLTVTLRDLAT
ncbi:MAG: SIMPL domain-containing protein, partial [Candidatus Nanopelagicales bacterium]